MTPLETRTRRRVTAAVAQSRLNVDRPSVESEKPQVHRVPEAQSRREGMTSDFAGEPAITLPGDAGKTLRTRKSFPSVASFAHQVVLGRAISPELQDFLSSQGRDSMSRRETFECIIERCEFDGEKIWDAMGIVGVIGKPPSSWLGADPLHFVVGVYRATSGDLPSPAITQSLLEEIRDGQYTRRSFITALSKEHGAPNTVTQELLRNLQPRFWSKWLPRWIGFWGQQEFDKSEVCQALISLNLCRKMARLDWGLLPFEALYNTASALYCEIEL